MAPRPNSNELVLGVRKNLNQMLAQTSDAPISPYSHDPWDHTESTHDLMYMAQKANGIEFGEEVEEIEDSMASQEQE